MSVRQLMDRVHSGEWHTTSNNNVIMCLGNAYLMLLKNWLRHFGFPFSSYFIVNGAQGHPRQQQQETGSGSQLIILSIVEFLPVALLRIPYDGQIRRERSVCIELFVIYGPRLVATQQDVVVAQEEVVSLTEPQ